MAKKPLVSSDLKTPTCAWRATNADGYEGKKLPRSKNYTRLGSDEACTALLGLPLHWACTYDYENLEGAIESGGPALIMPAAKSTGLLQTHEQLIAMRDDPKAEEPWRIFPVGAQGVIWAAEHDESESNVYLSDRWCNDLGTVCYWERKPGAMTWEMVIS
jgi:hypothetical protein